ncbi:hypothetical protein LXL04_026038 [Taraxacum kok-saghyz]
MKLLEYKYRPFSSLLHRRFCWPPPSLLLLALLSTSLPPLAGSSFRSSPAAIGAPEVDACFRSMPVLHPRTSANFRLFVPYKYRLYEIRVFEVKICFPWNSLS